MSIFLAWIRSSPRKKRFLLFVSLVIVVILILRMPFYSGDGSLKIRGWIRLGYQYEIDFEGFIVDQETTSKTYRFSGVPPQQYAFDLGWQTLQPSEDTRELSLCDFDVEVRLLADGETLVKIDKAPFAVGNGWFIRMSSYLSISRLHQSLATLKQL